MKVQLTQQQQYNSKLKQQPEFKGAVDTGFRFLATNQGVGAIGTDIAFMVIPRSASDAQRGPAAFFETLRREILGTANHALVGVYALGAGLGISALMGMNKKYGISANKIVAGPETLNILAENKEKQIKGKKSNFEYLKETLTNMKAYNPTSARADEKGFVKISEQTVNDVAKTLDKVISDKELDFDKWTKKTTPNSVQSIMNRIIADTGAESTYILESSTKPENGAKQLVSKTNLKSLLEDIYRVSDSYNQDKVKNAFRDQIKNGKSIAENSFIKSFTKFSKIRSGVGFLIATGIGMATQPLNIYLTKKKTGSDGFVGVEGRSKDNSKEFKAMKLATSAGFAGLTLASLNTGIKGFMGEMALKGLFPTIPQLKGIYGLTIVSRIMATRDKDELRESLTKDLLGFISWLMLGDIVNKCVAESLDKSVMNRTKEAEQKGYWKRLMGSELKTRDEVLVETLSKNNISTVKENGVAKTFKEMLSDLDGINNKQVKDIAKKKLKTLNKAQFVGYLFSGLILGAGIPNLNIYITNTLDKKRKAKAAAESAGKNIA